MNEALTVQNFDAIAVSSSAIGITASKLTKTDARGRVKKACRALMTIEDNDIRFRCDGTNPSATVGHKMASGSSIVIEGYDNLAAFRAIRVSADGVLHVSLQYGPEKA